MGPSAATAGDRVERAVLALLLALDGPTLSIEELVEEIGDRPGTRRALAKLQAVGLVERSDNNVRPTPAARRFDELNI
jgi:DNA-binding IclR family transcriptional regulator